MSIWVIMLVIVLIDINEMKISNVICYIGKDGFLDEVIEVMGVGGGGGLDCCVMIF